MPLLPDLNCSAIDSLPATPKLSYRDGAAYYHALYLARKARNHARGLNASGYVRSPRVVDTLEVKRAKKHAKYLKVKAARYAAGLTANGNPPCPKLTFEQSLNAAEERFWSHVRKDDDGCWYWTAGLNPGGYGKFDVQGRTLVAHRVAYVFTRGDIPVGKFVCHTCDHRACVNPVHLWVGTPDDNMQDKVKKGRQSRGAKHAAATCPPLLRGEQCYNAKLSVEKVMQMRKLRAAGQSFVVIAKQFGVCRQTACAAVNGKHWQHVPPRHSLESV